MELMYMESPTQLANGTVDFLNNVAEMPHWLDNYLRKVVYEVLTKFFRERELKPPSKYRPPLVLEVKGIQFAFDPEVFTTGKIYVKIPEDVEITGQCPDGYHLVIKNGLAYCELDNDLKKKYY